MKQQLLNIWNLFLLFTCRNCPACKVRFVYWALYCRLWPALPSVACPAARGLPCLLWPALPPVASPAACGLPYHLWPAPLCIICPHYPTNSTIFDEKLLDINVCFAFLYSFYEKYFRFWEEVSEILSQVYSTVQYSTVQVQYSTVQYSAVKYTVQYSAVQYSTLQ